MTFKYPLLFIILLFINPIGELNLYAKDNLSEEKIVNNQIKKKSQNKNYSDYILGPLDVINIKFAGLELFNNSYAINLEGQLYLPELNLHYVEGKTIKELEEELTILYEQYVYDPEISISIEAYRPVNAYISGEVKSPGLYNFAKEGPNGATRPTIFDALKAARGFSNYANLSEIMVTRKNSISNGGGKIQAKINLIPLINTGDQTQNIRIYDGDTIFIPKIDKIITDQIIKANRTNLSPDQIMVFMSGMEGQGPRTLKKGTSLVQALSYAGGKKFFTGNVEFVRFNYDGSTTKSSFRYNSNAKINSKNNPILMDGDLIKVKKTLLTSTAEIITDVTGPVLTWYGLFSLFD